MVTQNVCPMCGSKHSIGITATGGEWVGLVSPEMGGLQLRACAWCGVVYLPNYLRENARKKLEESKK